MRPGIRIVGDSRYPCGDDVAFLGAEVHIGRARRHIAGGNPRIVETKVSLPGGNARIDGSQKHIVGAGWCLPDRDCCIIGGKLHLLVNIRRILRNNIHILGGVRVLHGTAALVECGDRHVSSWGARFCVRGNTSAVLADASSSATDTSAFLMIAYSAAIEPSSARSIASSVQVNDCRSSRYR